MRVRASSDLVVPTFGDSVRVSARNPCFDQAAGQTVLAWSSQKKPSGQTHSGEPAYHCSVPAGTFKDQVSLESGNTRDGAGMGKKCSGSRPITEN